MTFCRNSTLSLILSNDYGTIAKEFEINYIPDPVDGDTGLKKTHVAKSHVVISRVCDVFIHF